MIKKLQYLRGHEVNIKCWINELPNLHIGTSIKKASYIAEPTQKILYNDNLLCNKIAIEITFHAHASSYGLLGVEFCPDMQKNALDIEVGYNLKNEIAFDETINYEKDVFVGVLEEYATAILNSSDKFFDDQNIPSGKIIYKVGANSTHKSSAVIFARLNYMLLSMLVNQNEEYSDEKIIALFKNSASFVSKLYPPKLNI